MAYLFSNAFRLQSFFFYCKSILSTSINLFFHIARSTSPDEDFELNQNLSIIIISHTKIILIKHFCIKKKIEVETRWQINKPWNIFFIHFIFFIYIMQDTAGEARMNSSVMYSYGPPHRAKQKQDDQLEHTYSSYVRIWDVTLKTCQKRWMIGRSGERGSGISVLAAWHDDDDIYKVFKIFQDWNCIYQVRNEQ